MSALPTPRHSVAGNVLRGSLGNLIEWYDFYTFTIFATYFGAAFFRADAELDRRLDAFAIFALAFVLRPVGSWLFGRLADRRGRRISLTLSILLMAGGSLLITLTPGHEVIGFWSVILLLLARLLQGLSVGGEYGTSSTYLSEIAPPGRRGFFSSFQYATLIGGQLAALIVQILLQTLLSEEQLAAWGWRVAFGIGALGALIVLWLRRGMDETLPAGQRELSRAGGGEPAPGSLRLLARYWRPALIVFGLTCGGSLAFYTFTTYTKAALDGAGLIARPTVSLIMFLALTLCLVLQPLFGWLSDRIGRTPLLVFFGVGGILGTWPILSTLARTDSPALAFCMLAAAMVIISGYTSVNAIVKAELFPASVRALGVGLSYGIANALFGGTATYVGTTFEKWGHPWGFSAYVIVIIAASLIVVVCALPHRAPNHLDPGHNAGGTRA
ncbi:MFS transporter [Mycetocola spongiae]|uniref:MFS transporter n=1 Tax=Mycetocola spongiae TaxID=2859226 RepID=UPI001CF54457|nr:MFS transporter [Mycetocola spongiae]UCR88273.1 MFS transporter [Mycetocola spongiae]